MGARRGSGQGLPGDGGLQDRPLGGRDRPGRRSRGAGADGPGSGGRVRRRGAGAARRVPAALGRHARPLPAGAPAAGRGPALRPALVRAGDRAARPLLPRCGDRRGGVERDRPLHAAALPRHHRQGRPAPQLPDAGGGGRRLRAADRLRRPVRLRAAADDAARHQQDRRPPGVADLPPPARPADAVLRGQRRRRAGAAHAADREAAPVPDRPPVPDPARRRRPAAADPAARRLQRPADLRGADLRPAAGGPRSAC